MGGRVKETYDKTTWKTNTPDYPDRRSFIKTCLGTLAGAFALGPAVLQGCGPRLSTITRPYRSMYDTVAHEILDVELELENNGHFTNNYMFLDLILDSAIERIEAMDLEDMDRYEIAYITLDAIDVLLKDYGFEYEKNSLLCYLSPTP